MDDSAVAAAEDRAGDCTDTEPGVVVEAPSLAAATTACSAEGT